MANWKEPKNNYEPKDQVVPEIFNVLAENELYLQETKIVAEQVQDVGINSMQYDTRENVEDKEIVKEFFGKVRKWLADLKALAFKGTISSNDIDDSAVNALKIDTNAIETSKIKDGAVTDSKIESVSANKVIGLHSIATSGSFNDLKDKPELSGGVQFKKLKGSDARYDTFELSNDARYTIDAPTNYSNPIMVEGMLTCGLKHWITFFLRPSIPFSYSTDVPMLIYERGVNGQANTSYGFLSLEAKISGRSLTISGYKINQSNNNAYSSNSPASRCYFALGAVHEIVIQK